MNTKLIRLTDNTNLEISTGHLTHVVSKRGTRDHASVAVRVFYKQFKKNTNRIFFRAGQPFYFFINKKKTAKMLRTLVYSNQTHSLY